MTGDNPSRTSSDWIVDNDAEIRKFRVHQVGLGDDEDVPENLLDCEPAHWHGQ